MVTSIELKKEINNLKRYRFTRAEMDMLRVTLTQDIRAIFICRKKDSSKDSTMRDRNENFI